MALDPSIALGVRLHQIEGPAQQYQNMLALQNAQRQSQVGELQYRNMLRDQRTQEQLSQDLQGADMNTPEGLKQIQNAYLKARNPEAASKFITADLERRLKLGQLDKQTLEMNATRAEQLSAGLAPLAAQIQQGRPVSHEQVFEIGNRLQASGLLPSGWQQSVPQNAMQLPSYIQGVVNQTEVGRKALAPFLPEVKAMGGDMVDTAPQSPTFRQSLGQLSQTAGERETARHNPVMEAIARTRANAATAAVGATREQTGVQREVLRANQIRDEQTAAVKPLDETQQKLTIAKQLLATATPASDVQLQAMLSDLFDKSRTTNLLFQSNRNFGTLQGRAAGMLSRVFTGQYTDQQRSEIYDMINAMEKNVIQPSRERVGSHYSRLSRAAGVNPALTQTPNFYADQDDGWKIERQ